MPDSYDCAATIERDGDGRHVASLPDFGWDATDGATRGLDVAESEARRMLNPDHAIRAATIERALHRLGRRLTVAVGEAVRPPTSPPAGRRYVPRPGRAGGGDGWVNTCMAAGWPAIRIPAARASRASVCRRTDRAGRPDSTGSLWTSAHWSHAPILRTPCRRRLPCAGNWRTNAEMLACDLGRRVSSVRCGSP